MTHFAAYDELSIYAVAETVAVAIRKARAATDNTAQFQVARISDELADQIDCDGWNGHSRSFDVRDGFIVDTTEADEPDDEPRYDAPDKYERAHQMDQWQRELKR